MADTKVDYGSEKRAASSGGALTTRVIIDVPVLDLWIEEGDLSMLLDDAESVKGTALRPDRPPVALLNGRRMYVKLVEALGPIECATARGVIFP